MFKIYNCLYYFFNVANNCLSKFPISQLSLPVWKFRNVDKFQLIMFLIISFLYKTFLTHFTLYKYTVYMYTKLTYPQNNSRSITTVSRLLFMATGVTIILHNINNTILVIIIMIMILFNYVRESNCKI